MCMMIADREVAANAPLFVIAEIGLNHGGDIDDALALVDAAAGAGASAVKLQSLRGETLVAAGCPGAGARRQRLAGRLLPSVRARRSGACRCRGRARARGLAFMSTPFEEAAVDMLERLGCDAYKIASGDVTHHRLIERAALTGKPVVISSGMSGLEEVRDAVAVARRAGATSIAVLHCVSAYPVPSGSENLRAIATLTREFGPASRPLRSRHE